MSRPRGPRPVGPPPFARALLARLLAPEVRADVLGDLEEGFHDRVRRRGRASARRWYRAQAGLLLLRPSLLRGVADLPAAPSRLFAMLLHDLRFALRSTTRHPGLSTVVALTLALALGANATVFGLVDALLLRPLPVEEPDRVVELFGASDQDASAGGQFQGFLPLSYPDFEDLRDRASTLEGAYAYSTWPVSLVVGGEPERGNATYVSASYFDVLGVGAALGRVLVPGEDRVEGEGTVAVLHHGFWERRFGADPGVLGRTVVVNDRPFTVVGVAPEGFRGTGTAGAPDLWLPVSTIGDVPPWGALWRRRGLRMFFAGARLAPGRTLDEARAELDGLARWITETYPETSRNRGLRAVPLQQATVNPNLRAGFVGVGAVLGGMVGVLLLVACLNVANLLLARAVGRRREMAVRTSLGAGRGRLVSQLLVESLVLFALGGVGGALVFAALRSVLSGLRVPALFGLSLSMGPGRGLEFTAAVTLVCAVVFGLLPALRAARSEPAADLREGSRGRVGGGSRWVGALVGAQVALSLVALVGTGLFARSLAAAGDVDPGFDPEGLGVLSVDLAAQGMDEEEGRVFYRRALEEARAAPGVADAAVGSLRPFSPAPLRRVSREDEALDDPEAGLFVRADAVSPGYLEVMGIRVERGRGFRPSDDADGPGVAVVNRRLAEMLWPGEDPLGRRVRMSLTDGPVEVVGVVPTARYVEIDEEPQPALYRPLEQQYAPTASVWVRLRSGGSLERVRAAVQALDPTLPVFDVEPAEALLGRALWTARAVTLLLAVFGAAGLLLAALGVYGVVSRSVRDRTREMGLRIALGADRGRVMRQVMGRVLAVAGIGVVAGLAAAALLSPTVGSLLYGVSPADPLTYAGGAAVMVGVAALAALLPARRATRVDPVEALRAE